MIIFIIFGFFIRLMPLINRSFYGDEIFDITVATGKLSDIFFSDLWHGPLNYYVLFFWSKIFGVGEVVSRIPAISFNVTTSW